MSSITLAGERRVTSSRRVWLLGLAFARIVLGVVAIPLAPLLYRDQFLVLVLLRPTKEVFLAGGFLARQGDVVIWMLVLAALPLCIGGVWLFFFLGRAYSQDIGNGRLSGFAGRVLTPEKIESFERALDKQGPKLIFLGRLAVLSSAAVAAAAGAAGMDTKKFLAVDLAGGLLSIAYTVAAGYMLGHAYETAGPWITAVGVVAVIGFAYLLGRALKAGSDEG